MPQGLKIAPDPTRQLEMNTETGDIFNFEVNGLFWESDDSFVQVRSHEYSTFARLVVFCVLKSQCLLLVNACCFFTLLRSRILISKQKGART